MRRVVFTKKAIDDYVSLPLKLKILADKQFALLIKDIHYPSIRAKKYDEVNDIWQGRISKAFRFYFKIEGDSCIVLTIIKHP